MNPYQFLRHTPSTNCGECGYPACLAFAVAVTKAGMRADRCPYLQQENLPSEFFSSNSSNTPDALQQPEKERHTALAAHLRSKMQGIDLHNLAPSLGANCSAEQPELLQFSFLGRSVQLGTAGIFINGEPPVDPRDQILLYNYVASGGGKKPEYTWVGMESLPNSISKIRTLSTYCEERIAERFSDRVARLIELCATLDAVPAEYNAAAALIIPVLPRVPLLLLFWNAEPEDGFAAKVKILFDQHVLNFLDLESLVFVAERTADRLLELD